MQDAKLKDRALGMDITRAVACAMVVLLHVSATYFYSFGPLWIPSLAFDALSRSCVPIFFMLSGALLLWQDEPPLRFYRKRASRIIPPLIFWTIVYVALFGDTSIPVIAQFGIYLTRPYGHLWYFYALFGLYLSAPYLGRMLRASSELESRIFLLLWFFFACILYQAGLIYARWWDPATFLGAQLFSGYLGLFVLGGYLRRYRPITTTGSRWICSVVFVGSSVATAFLTYSHSMHMGRPDESVYFGYRAPLVVVAAASAFAFLTSISQLPTRLAALVRVISDCSLGIYCLHVMIISFYIERLHLADAIHTTWFKMPILWAAIFSTAAIAVYLARKIPVLRRVA